MKISIFGLGYVGCVGIGCLSRNGHSVIGVDTTSLKVDLINSGKPTIIENGIGDLIAKGRETGRISATTDPALAVMGSDISFICVGTPNASTGHLDLSYVYAVAEQIGKALKQKPSYHTVVIRSTVFPGTNEKVTEIITKASGKIDGQDFGVVSNPEFLREGTAVADYFNPPVTVVGTRSEKSLEIMRELYVDMDAEFSVVDVRVAEMIKYVNNSYHGLKVVFANEVGNICKKLGIDSHQVMALFCKDKQLNISPYYFKPGFAYGGSCLPKDLRGLNAIAHDHYLDVPVLASIERSNRLQIDKAFELITAKNVHKIGFLGLSFKQGTDDLRNSPTVDLIEMLLGKGYEIKVFDQNVHLSNLTGTNKAEIEKRIPHINKLLQESADTLIEASDLVVITTKEAYHSELAHRFSNKRFLDLVRVSDSLKAANYEGISW